jgi:hypothetical protein
MSAGDRVTAAAAISEVWVCLCGWAADVAMQAKHWPLQLHQQHTPRPLT